MTARPAAYVAVFSATATRSCGGGEADPVQLAEGLGEQVGAGEGGALVSDLGQHDGGDVAQHPVVEIVYGEQPRRGALREVSDPGVRVGADERAGAVLPLGDQLAQGPDVLVLAGGEGGLLPHLDDFAGGGLPAVGRGEGGDEVVLGGLDRARALGEVLAQVLRDAVDLPLRLGRPAALLRRPAPAELGGQLVGEDAVVQLGHADCGPEERLGVERAPCPVGDGLDAVEDDDVGVQLRVAGAGVPVVERGRDDAADVLLDHAALAHPGGEDLALAVGDDRLERAPVGGVDPGAGWGRRRAPTRRRRTSARRTSGRNRRRSAAAFWVVPRWSTTCRAVGRRCLAELLRR